MSANYFQLSSGSLIQNWSDPTLITANDSWAGVSSIVGYLGNIDAGSPTNVDPQTLTAADLGDVDVIANQTNPNTLTNGGVAEFDSLADPTIALQGSGTADAPGLVLYLDATGQENVTVAFNARDIDGSADNAAQQLAVQYRVGDSGAWQNAPGGYVADVTTGPSATGATPVSLVLPSDVNGQSQVEVRILTTNAGGNDEWVGIDDINVSSVPSGSGSVSQTVQFAPDSITVSHPEGDSGTTAYSFTVQRIGGTDGDVSFTADLTSSSASADDFAGVPALPQTISGTIPAGATQATITVDVNGDVTPEPNETFNLTLTGVSNSDAGVPTSISATQAHATGTIVSDDIVDTAIYTVQGSGQTSDLVGQTVTTTGVVTAVDTNGGRGFYIQDQTGDGDQHTSDGIFVFAPSGALPTAGQLVQVTGEVAEFLPGGSAPGSLSTTEIDADASGITVLGSGFTIAPTLIGGADGLKPPTEDVAAGNAFFESLEGMLVTVNQPTVVGPTNSFGEIFTVASDGSGNPIATGPGGEGLSDRGTLHISGGDPVFGDSDTINGDFNPERIQIDTDTGILPGFSNPAVNAGATLDNVTGVVNYDFGDYQVVATQEFGVADPGTLTRESGSLTGDAGKLLVASYNAENLDPGDGQARFDTIADQVLHNLNAPDIVALQEIQDNNGPTDDGTTSATTTLQKIVDALNGAAGPSGPHYAFIDNPFISNDTNGGEPGGNIRTAFIYRTDRVSFVDGSLATVAADGSAITSGIYTDQATNPDNPFFESRPPLSATFTFNGEDVTVLSDHFTSKGGSGALFGDQPPFDGGEVSRAAQAQAVNTYVDNLLAANPNANVVVAGDFNDFDFEQPIDVLKGTATLSNYNVPGGDPIDATATYTPGGTAVLNDLFDTLPPDQRYDYVYEGNAETLDHMFVTGSLSGGAQFQPVHINSEFADQSSDHDPLLASFTFDNDNGNDVVVASGTTVTDQIVLVNDDTLTVESGGTISGATDVLWAGGSASPGVVITNDGTITATSRGIDTGAVAVDGNLTIVNHNTISATADAIRIQSLNDTATGHVEIDNDGTIRAQTGGEALDLKKSDSPNASFLIDNETGGIIESDSSEAIAAGHNTTINNSGLILGNASTLAESAIDFDDNAGGIVHNAASGVISGGKHGITGEVPVTIENEGVILGRNGSGINLDTPTDSVTDIVNHGVIIGTATNGDGDGVDVDGLVNLDNDGTISAAGIVDGETSEAITVGGGMIHNGVGGTITSVQRAINVDDSSGNGGFASTTIENEGTIIGRSGEAINIVGTFDDAVTNKATIIGSVALGGGDDVFNAYTGSSVSGPLDGGAGNDIVNLLGSGNGSLGAFANVETIALQDGSWTFNAEGSAVVAFQDGMQQLDIVNALLDDGQFSDTIGGFGAGDVIDLQGIGLATQATLGDGNLLTISGGSDGPVTLQLDPTQDFSSRSFQLASDGSGGTEITLGQPSGPQLLSSQPGDDSTGVAVGANIVLTFNEAVKQGDGVITLSNQFGDTRAIAVDDPQITFDGNKVIINPTVNLAPNTTYDVTIPEGAITNTAGVDFAGVAGNDLDFTTGGNMSNQPLNIVLTNDDGYNAPGITVLYDALLAAGFNVHIVAPEVNQSAQGGSLGGIDAISHPVDVTEFSPGNYSVDGRPATAVLTALDDLFAGNPPDLVISGTNRGDNIGESENISGTVNGALEALFNGVPAIAVSASSDANGDYTTAFNNAATFVVDLLGKLQADQEPGAPILPTGEGLTINVPGQPDLEGVAVTTITQESNGSFPISEISPGVYGSTFVPPGASSGSNTAEGAQFLDGRITVSPIDGDWGATLSDRNALDNRLSAILHGPTPTVSGEPLDIMLVNDDGYNAPGLAATRDALLAAGYNVTVVAPATDQSGVGSALTLSSVTVTQFDQGYIVGATPATTVQTSLDALLTGDNAPDLIVSGANAGANVGIENADHSGTLGATITALFNYEIPSIALSTGTDSSGHVPDGLYDLSGEFLVKLLANLQATENGTGHLLPTGLGLSINVPPDADLNDFAFTLLDQATNNSIEIGHTDPGGDLGFQFGGEVNTNNPYSEGTAYNDGKITITPIDGNFASHDLAIYQEIAELLGTEYGTPSSGIEVTDNADGGHDLHIIVPASLSSDDGTKHIDNVFYDGSGAIVLPDNIENGSLTGTSDNDLSGNAHANTLSGGAGDNMIQGFDGKDIIAGNGGDDSLYGGSGNDTVNGGDGNDKIDGGDGSDFLAGDAGNDTVHGADGNDSIDGGTGNDTLYGDGGNDTIHGGDGVDVIAGDAGADTLYGDAGNDTIGGKDGNDVIDGGTGNDTLYGDAGNDTIHGGNDVDIVDGGAGNDKLYGDAGDDTVRGRDGNDTIEGGDGKDALYGDAGNDTINGDAGNDIINGGAGNDKLWGGAGADAFVFDAGAGKDVVYDFNFDEGDRIDVGNQAYEVHDTTQGVDIDLADGSSVLLAGLHTQQLHNEAFV